MSSNQNSKKKKNELSFTKKCILMANIQYETDKIFINTFSFMPVVKLYTSTLKQELFNYSKIKGPLLLFQDKKTKNYYIRIYDINDYSIRFNLEINNETKKNYIKVESNFYCFSLKMGCLGFLFSSNIFPLTDSDNLYLDVIDNLIDQFGKKYQIITLGEQYVQTIHEVVDYLIFSGFLESSQLLGNMEFDYEDNLFNVYIDKKFDRKLFKKLFYNYDKNNLYPFRPIAHDYLNIYNKPYYVDLLVGHLMNNFKEQIEIYKKRKENNIKEKNRKSKREKYTQGGDGVIGEENNEDYEDERTTSNSIGRFFSGLNPFK